MRTPILAAALAAIAAAFAGCGGGSRGGTESTGPMSTPAQAAAERCRRGEAMRAGGDLAGARAEFDRALEADPQWPEALLGRGRVRQVSSDVDGAIADLDAALRAAGGVLLRSARPGPSGVYADRDRALAMSRLLVDIHVLRGLLRESKGDAAGAREDIDEARTIDARQAEEALARERQGGKP